MGLDDFKTYPNWIEILKKKCKKSCLSFTADPANPKRRISYWFKISSDTAAVVGKTHYSNRSNKRDGNQIELDYKDELEITQSSAVSYLDGEQFERTEIIAVVINHNSEGEYNSETDDFTVLGEQELKFIPASGKKQFRDDLIGYQSPFDNHLNSWERVFDVFENCY